MLVAAATAAVKGPHTLPLVAGYLFASAAVSIPCIRWRARVHARAEETTE